ncbi:MAG: hypothetical protein KDM91_20620 [Verrucomicrobiae bacterium]|nr:hypothetical protein [Verrucomicrobiae bacterium]MCP5538879.1 hypothetical protein [Akkermansiaceae bacterium]
MTFVAGIVGRLAVFFDEADRVLEPSFFPNIAASNPTLDWLDASVERLADIGLEA